MSKSKRSALLKLSGSVRLITFQAKSLHLCNLQFAYAMQATDLISNRHSLGLPSSALILSRLHSTASRIYRWRVNLWLSCTTATASIHQLQSYIQLRRHPDAAVSTDQGISQSYGSAHCFCVPFSSGH